MLNIGRQRDGQEKKDLGNKIDFNNENFQFVNVVKFEFSVEN